MKPPNSNDEMTRKGWNRGLLTNVLASVSGLFSLKSNATPIAARVCRP